LNNLGAVFVARGEFTRAKQRYVDNLEILRQLDDRDRVAAWLTNVGEVTVAGPVTSLGSGNGGARTPQAVPQLRGTTWCAAAESVPSQRCSVTRSPMGPWPSLAYRFSVQVVAGLVPSHRCTGWSY